jgi:HEPN domain-containing protein
MRQPPKESSFMSDDDRMIEADRRQIALAWRAIAAEDGRVALACMAMTPPALSTAAYLCQQAAEKNIKGLLVLAETAFGKTHDLNALAALAEPLYPNLREFLDALRPMTIWGVAFRYPPGAEEVPEPVPSTGELHRVLDMLRRLGDTLQARATDTSGESV